ncbi:MAG: hypothetical protein [Cressdnaviricota sp.]|nr:MAG: hypothetical protein [Cressdnaviricota sp.]
MADTKMEVDAPKVESTPSVELKPSSNQEPPKKRRRVEDGSKDESSSGMEEDTDEIGEEQLMVLLQAIIEKKIEDGSFFEIFEAMFDKASNHWLGEFGETYYKYAATRHASALAKKTGVAPGRSHPDPQPQVKPTKIKRECVAKEDTKRDGRSGEPPRSLPFIAK